MDNARPRLIFDEMSQKIIDTAAKMSATLGAHTVTVKKILEALGITNRVFYNRFHNIDEVLRIVYKNTVDKIRESVFPELSEKKDFFEYVMEVVENALVLSYDSPVALGYSGIGSATDTDSYREWWTGEIKKLIENAMEKDYIKPVDPEIMSHSIWCFCRGYNVDAVNRGIPREEAIRNFRYSFGFFIEGLKK